MILDKITNWVQELCDALFEARMQHCRKCGKLFKSRACSLIGEDHLSRHVLCIDCRKPSKVEIPDGQEEKERKDGAA